ARILALAEGTRFLVLAPVIRGQKGEYKDLFEDMLKRGFVRARVDGQVVRLTDDLKLDRRIKHDIAIVIDRLQIMGQGSGVRGQGSGVGDAKRGRTPAPGRGGGRTGVKPFWRRPHCGSGKASRGRRTTALSHL